MYLYLLRHGVAVPPGTPGIADDDRPLTPDGRKKMHEIARGFVSLELNVDRIVTSPLSRARETAEIMAFHLGLGRKLEVDGALAAGQTAESIAAWLAGLEDCDRMIVGHNPGFSDLTGRLLGSARLGEACNLRKGGIVALESTAEAGAYRLDWMARPRLLRRSG